MAFNAFSRLSLALAAAAVVGVGATYLASGGAMFSPGALHAGDASREQLGGVTSHAELSSQCGACHATPGSARPMSARCLECHTDIKAELADSTKLHSALTDVRSCMNCHTEHLGATASLTRMNGSSAAHERFGFALDGAHARVACVKCHEPASSGGRFTKAPKTCVGCHANDDKHRGEFGNDCASCHTTSTWEGARFEHDVFPLDHGGGGRISCATCHTDRRNYKQYTCMGCHEHSPERIAAQHRGEVRASNLSDCLRCHAGGRGEHGERGERGEREEHEGRRRRRE